MSKLPLGKVVNIPDARRVFVIPDIHGCSKTLQSLLKQLGFNADDALFLLGDYVNKGPSSRKTLDLIMDLCSSDKVYPLLGNHDLNLLNYLEKEDEASKSILIENKNEDFFGLSQKEKAGYIKFLQSLPYYYIFEDFILVHAGLNFNLSNPFLGKEDMLNIRDFRYDSAKARGKTIVHGHNPVTRTVIDNAIAVRDRIIPLDNGCVYYGAREDMGQLVALNLRDFNIQQVKHCE